MFLHSGFDPLRLFAFFCLPMHARLLRLFVTITQTLSVFWMLLPSVPALRCLGMISGAGGLPRCLDSSCAGSCNCVAPAVDAVLLCMCLVAQGAV